MAARRPRARSRSSASEPAGAARADALRLLAARDRTEAELRQRLRAAGHADPAIGAALATLRAAGLLDDAAVALRLAERRVRAGFGSGCVRAELAARGVPEDARAAALALAAEDEPGRAAAVLARRRLPVTDPAGRARAARFLLRRGFPEEVVRAVVGLPAGEP